MGGRRRKKKSSKVSNKSQKKKQVLSGHHQKGKKFIPPMMELAGMQEVSYIKQCLPELVWIALLNHHYGYHRGVELATELGKIAFEHRGVERHINFALASSYDALDDEAKHRVVSDAAATEILDPIRDAVAPLVVLYEKCPLAFLGPPEGGRDRDILVGEIREVVGDIFDKYKTPALVVQGCVTYISHVNGSLRFSANVRVPDIEALVNAPKSEAALHAGGHVRNHTMMAVMIASKERTIEWPDLFWNQGLIIDSCKLNRDGDQQYG